MNKFVVLGVALALANGVQAGTDKTTGEVCRGSSCGGPGGNPSYVVNVYKSQPTQVVAVRANPVAVSGADASATAAASSTASAVSGVGGSGGAGGAATVNVYPDSARTSGMGGATGGTTKLRYEGGYTVKGYTPDPVPSNNTANCVRSAAVTTWWFGFSIPFTDEGCDVWRDHDMLRAREGTEFQQAADMRLCDKPEVAKLLAFCPKKDKGTSTTTASTWSH